MRIQEIELTEEEKIKRRHRKWLMGLIEQCEEFRRQDELAEQAAKNAAAPKTPEQQRIAILQTQADRASQAVKAERNRQQIATQSKRIAQSQAVIAKAKEQIRK